MGQPPKVDPLALAEHLRRVELDAVNLALSILGQRVQTMDPQKVEEFLRQCGSNPPDFISKAKEFFCEQEAPIIDVEAQPPQVEAVSPSDPEAKP